MTQARPTPWIALVCLMCSGQPGAEAEVPTAKPHDSVPESDSRSPPAAEPADPPETGEFQSLTTGPADVLLWVPGSTGRVPLLLVAHGAGDGPDWHCAFWAEFVGARAFVLCLRGRPLDSSGLAFYFPQHHDLGERIEAALSSFASAFSDRWTGKHSVYVAYSQGATMGALLLPELASHFGLALLIEGGYEQWPVKNAREFRRGGGRRVFFACGTSTCEKGARRSTEWLERGEVSAMQVTATGAGHTPAGPVGEIAKQGLSWLVHGLDGWEALQTRDSDLFREY